MKKLASYKNGNYSVTIFDDGTKIRKTQADEFIPEFPESIDLKLTDRCDGGCRYCHESSTPNGKHSDMALTLFNLQELPSGTEIALGGGNPLCYPHLVEFLIGLAKYNYIANITVNAKHLPEYGEMLNGILSANLIKGIGITYDGEHYFDTNNTVYHLIAGIHSLEDVKHLINTGRKVLILGYKFCGRGNKYFNLDLKRRIEEFRDNLWEVIGKGVISFDNLAIEQLEVRDHFTDEAWEKFYMGDDGQFTMYYDAVEQYYAPSSISTTQTSAHKLTVAEYFRRRCDEDNK